MPSALIEVRRSLSQQAETDIMDAVHRALIEAFQDPDR
jgi:hypothetical protein